MAGDAKVDQKRLIELMRLWGFYPAQSMYPGLDVWDTAYRSSG